MLEPVHAWPLLLYGRYEIREILTAAGWLTESRRTPHQSGKIALEDAKIELLFVRENKEAAYCTLGPATRIHIEGDRPMSPHWKLEVALPMELFRAFSVLRG
ncbi:MAG: hypothetical protein ACREUK_09105 [Burkholderiales bacterium]